MVFVSLTGLNEGNHLRKRKYINLTRDSKIQIYVVSGR